jgi:3-deoxy-manno-octulosonate cytidylyltransferase (CMP-KDO synthetase)
VTRRAAIIPARLGSRRLPRKVLADLGGVPMVARVAQRAQQARLVGEVYVATGDEEIAEVVSTAGFDVIRTLSKHASGTDRVAEAARILGLGSGDLIVNVQGDEPFLEPGVVDSIVEALTRGAAVATAAAPLEGEPEDRSVVKVVCDSRSCALYFSRSRIPLSGPWLQHIGIYGFRADALQRFTQLRPGALEKSERLEQLRFLENGIDIQVIQTSGAELSVDTPEDLARARTIWNRTVQACSPPLPIESPLTD